MYSLESKKGRASHMLSENRNRDYLRMLREDRGLTKKVLIERLSEVIPDDFDSRQYLRIEAGETQKPSWQMLKGLSLVFHMPLEEIILLEEAWLNDRDGGQS